MVRSIDEFLDEPEHDGRDHTGVMGVGGGATPTEYGNGSLGDITISAFTETSGDKHYNSLIIGASGDLVALTKRKLVIRTIADMEVTAGRRIHADGRGMDGGDGGQGKGSVSSAGEPGLPGPSALAICGAGGGGGAGSRHNGATAGQGGGAGGEGRGHSFGATRHPWRAATGGIGNYGIQGFGIAERSKLIIPGGTLKAAGDYIDFEWAMNLDVVQQDAATNLLLTVKLNTAVLLNVNVGNQTVIGSGTGLRVLRVQGRLYYTAVGQQLARTSLISATTTESNFVSPEDATSDMVLGFSIGTSGGTMSANAIPLLTYGKLESPNPGSAGAPGGNPSYNGSPSAGSAGVAMTAAEQARVLADYAAELRGAGALGGGGGGGGGASGLSGAGGTGGAGGVGVGAADFGDGADGGAGGGQDGGGGGGGGAGGGHIVIWCGGDLTVIAGGIISANGGDGGAGGLTGNSFGGNGAGAAGGGGGFVGIFYAGALTQSGTISATAGAGGLGSSGGGAPAGTNGGAGAAGLTVLAKVAS
jgi:hypothetical protein